MAADDPLTICLASRALSREAHSGIARATWELAGALAGRGHAVHLITRGAEPAAPPPAGVTVHRALAPPLRAPAAVAAEPVAGHLGHAVAVHRAVAEVHERQPVDAVVAPLWCCEGVVCMLDPRFPTVVSCMTSMTTIEELRGGAPRSAEHDQLIALERATMSRARYVHGLTRRALEKTLSDYGAEPAEVEVVGRGLADRAGGPSPTADGGPPAILFVGRLEHRKGVDVLLDAARRLTDGGIDFSLVLVGPDGDDTGTGAPHRLAFQRAAADDPALAARVRFAGAVDDDSLHELYARADVVCVPSRYESHGVVLVEAMMHGRPIVACGAGGIPEVVEEGGNALLAAPGDPESLAACLGRVLDDPDLRRRLGTRSRELFEERFEADAVAGRFAGFLARVASVHPRATAPPEDLGDRLAALVRQVLPVDGPAAADAAAELLAPSGDRWRATAIEADAGRAAWQARALEAERQVEAWRERALEAERQRGEAAGSLRRLSGSRSWRITEPLRRLRAALRRA